MIGMTVCSGIGAPEVSAPWIDWRWQSEIEPFPCAVLRERFPDAVNLGDMTKFQEWPDATVDVLAGGTPCQSFSLNGLRRGLEDPRGNLALVFMQIVGRYRPRWVVWENVVGCLSVDGGRAFASIVAALGKLGYWWAYRVLDARRLGAALPRPRVFLVGYLGGRSGVAAFLPDAKNCAHPSNRGGQRPRGHTLSVQNAGCSNARGNAICVGGRLRSMTPLETERSLFFPTTGPASPTATSPPTPARTARDTRRLATRGRSTAGISFSTAFRRLRRLWHNRRRQDD